MMDDHILLSQVRNDLSDALKLLLKHQIMFREDFVASREHVQEALRGLDDLIAQQDEGAAETLRQRDAGIR
jgi:hypothetical protein